MFVVIAWMWCRVDVVSCCSWQWVSNYYGISEGKRTVLVYAQLLVPVVFVGRSHQEDRDFANSRPQNLGRRTESQSVPRLATQHQQEQE